MYTQSLCSIVIPVYDESENVALMVNAIENAMNHFNYEIILIDDCSKDDTVNTIKKLKNHNISLIELKKNYGQSSALSAGIDFAKGDYIITMDGDLQNDPTDIPMMLETMQLGEWDVVTGIRQKRKDNLIRKIPSKIANYIIRKSTGLDIKDHGCALKVFNRETAKDLDIYGELHRFITLVAYINGARVTQVKVKHHPRKYGKSKYGLNRTFKVLNDLILLLFQRKYLQKPIYLFGNIGMLIFGSGMLINVYLFTLKILSYEIGSRPLLILGVLLTLVGIQLFTVGIILDLQMRTYYESQNKRPFNIRKISTFESKPEESIYKVS
ncbi:glycosyltransferase family 2 protein [Urechidicola croceus]|uniref:Glycosyltransferase n=1 Tax=Urechidicola croceus TaxID=1850246 RepID=A0A1D8P8Q4_9FLAO|nr:glycosyltransferase family 2 protein [Urechidicola croceus]AOW20949.1 glycosyltransferase [Urechidicola croceus]